ncbi:MAG: hypothetical protein AAB425_10250, partial [Bdellovibrionota bacterium]
YGLTQSPRKKTVGVPRDSADEIGVGTINLSRKGKKRPRALGKKLAPRMDIDPRGSELTGLAGLFERSIRSAKGLVHGSIMLLLYVVAIVILGMCVAPGIAILEWTWRTTADSAAFLRFPALGIAVAASYFAYGFSLVALVPAINSILKARLEPWRGPYYSAGVFKWYIHNSLTYLVRFTFLDFITPTPYSNLFFKAMGMKIGKGGQINTIYVSDPSLIEIGEKVTIGGSVTLIGHYAAGGFLVLARTRIGNGATIGLRAIVFGGVEIGADARVLPNSVVLPKTIIPAGETWGGVPAVRIDVEKMRQAMTNNSTQAA